MVYLEEYCPVCGTGTVGFRLCSDGVALVLMCDECDALWATPDRWSTTPALYSQPPDFTVPGMRCSIAPPSRWATSSEVERREWTKYVAGESE